MSIFRYECKANLKITLIWAVSLLALAIFFIILYPSFGQDVDKLNQVLAAYPPELVKALGLGDLTSFAGFYGYAILYATLCAAIQATNLGIGILSKEGRVKTADFLLTKPVSRGAVVSAKLAAAVMMLLITQIVFVAGSTIAAILIAGDSVDMTTFMQINLGLVITQYVFFAIGFMIAGLLQKIRSVITLSLGIVFTFFALGLLDSVLDKDWLRYFIPFKYFDAPSIIANGGLEMQFVAVSVGVIIACIAAAYVMYLRRDVHAV
ncbi:ABC transporter permease subunit [Culicoidibacter larvae]|uniref:ABC transporter permease n=1 Tax=Culicoidibacter larvae TaxID=2579976 RepID=A0A5R8QB85_9FIRM|nr:ABC transporter permease subunit [Culicoidibacter larvae]TLG72919.1 ABC transporter permease [Culicoidibacter larvae]